VRREGGPLGIVEEPDRITIPPWFLASRATAERRGGTWGVRVRPDHPAVVPRLWLPEGSWRAVTEPEGLQVRVRCGGQTVAAPFTLRRRQRVDVEVGAVDRTWVTGLVLERAEEGEACP
jgi:hypothetical protein